MADQPAVYIGENSPERIAYKLMENVLFAIEKRDWENLDRQTLLDTYAECIQAVRGYRRFEGQASRADDDASSADPRPG